jgi:hypothetical protein
MGRKNDVWSSQSALHLRKNRNSSLGPTCSYLGASPSFWYYPQTENLNGGVPIAIKRYPRELPKWPSGMLFDLFGKSA